MRHLLSATVLTLAALACAAGDSSIYTQAVEHAGRSAKDHERDARELPAEVMEFAGFKPGMKVADVFAGGGYYSELVSYVVGPKGEVYLVNNPPYEDYAKEGLTERFKDPARLPNVKRSVVDPKDLKLGKGRLDAAMIIMSYHDLFYDDAKNGWPQIDAVDFINQIHTALKPGGAFLIVDHAANAGTGSSVTLSLHRIEESWARKEIEARGFKFEKSFDKLRNPQDDHSLIVFDPKIRGKTDRFVHLYRKT